MFKHNWIVLVSIISLRDAKEPQVQNETLWYPGEYKKHQFQSLFFKRGRKIITSTEIMFFFGSDIFGASKIGKGLKSGWDVDAYPVAEMHNGQLGQLTPPKISS